MMRAPDQHKFTAVIFTSAWGETIRAALLTVQKNAHLFSELHIVSQGPLHLTKQSKEYLSDIEQRCHVSVVKNQGGSDGDWLSAVKTNIVITIPPYVFCAIGPLNALAIRVDGQHKSNQQFHAILPMFRFTHHQRSVWWQSWFPSPWVGFFMLLFLIDYWRALISRFTIHGQWGMPIRSQELLRGHERVLLGATQNEWRWPWESNPQSSAIYMREQCIAQLPKSLSTCDFFLQAVQQQQRSLFGTGWRLWYIIVAIFYAFLGFTWWYQTNVSAWATMMFHWQSQFRVGMYVAFSICNWLILRRYFIYGYRMHVLILCFPLLIPLLFPWVLVWARLYQTHAQFEQHQQQQLEDEED